MIASVLECVDGGEEKQEEQFSKHEDAEEQQDFQAVEQSTTSGQGDANESSGTQTTASPGRRGSAIFTLKDFMDTKKEQNNNNQVSAMDIIRRLKASRKERAARQLAQRWQGKIQKARGSATTISPPPPVKDDHHHHALLKMDNSPTRRHEVDEEEREGSSAVDIFKELSDMSEAMQKNRDHIHGDNYLQGSLTEAYDTNEAAKKEREMNRSEAEEREENGLDENEMFEDLQEILRKVQEARAQMETIEQIEIENSSSSEEEASDEEDEDDEESSSEDENEEVVGDGQAAGIAKATGQIHQDSSEEESEDSSSSEDSSDSEDRRRKRRKKVRKKGKKSMRQKKVVVQRRKPKKRVIICRTGVALPKKEATQAPPPTPVLPALVPVALPPSTAPKKKLPPSAFAALASGPKSISMMMRMKSKARQFAEKARERRAESELIHNKIAEALERSQSLGSKGPLDPLTLDLPSPRTPSGALGLLGALTPSGGARTTPPRALTPRGSTWGRW